MNNWILMTIFYAIFSSFYECSKKKAVINNSIYEVLALFSSIAFILIIPFSRNVFNIDMNYLLVVLLKSSIIVLAWILGLKAIEKMQLGIYGMLKISTIIFSVILSSILLKESITVSSIIGIIIVVVGLILINQTNDGQSNKTNNLKAIIFLLISCLLNSVSSILDKFLLSHISAGQLQFWFLLFLMFFYWIILLLKNKNTDIKHLLKNYWIYLAAIFLIVGDRALFNANEVTSSKVIVMTMLKQLSVIFSIFLGKLFFNEKGITKKLLYSILIIIGVLIMINF
jgi:transporter family protein